MNQCAYCAEPFPVRITKTGRHQVQPRACCPEHAKRLATWDTWVRESGLAAIGSAFGPDRVAPLPPGGPSLLAAIAGCRVSEESNDRPALVA
jgi:hypothetical protein